MVPAAQPRLMKRVASFLLVSGPTWRSPLPLELRLPHSHLYSSPRRFPVESHLLLGCSHKIPNGTSFTSGLSQRSTMAPDASSSPCSQGLSRHVLPHAAPRFFARCGHRHWWSSPNFASIILAPREDTLALRSGGRTQDQGMAKLSREGAMVPLLDFRRKGQGHLFIEMELGTGHRSSSSRRGNLIFSTIYTWSTRSLSATGRTDTSDTSLMTSFQSLSSSGGSGIYTWGQVLCLHSAPVGRYTTTSSYTWYSPVKIPDAFSYSKE
jgi:hypothetical protein